MEIIKTEKNNDRDFYENKFKLLTNNSTNKTNELDNLIVSHDSLLYKYEFLEKAKEKIQEDNKKITEDVKRELKVNSNNLNCLNKLEIKLETLQDSYNITNNKLLTLTEE